ncbi:MAG: bifunctional UDP-N-acetylglucosamine diphosphorylase/glucosamine-1-phosphate N-acetyltransferase GlmU [Sphingomonadales bacterium]
MANKNLSAIILAAGKGTRMGSSIHKVLQPVGGRPMILHLVDTLKSIGVSKTVVVVGNEKEQVQSAVEGAQFAIQEPQLGTGHAVLAAQEDLGNFDGNVLILYGDVPLVSSTTMKKLINSLDNNPLAVLGFRAEVPGSYGRLVLNSEGSLEEIIEASEANDDILEIDLCNSGIMALDKKLLFSLLAEVTNENAKGEYYLTDIVGLSRNKALNISVVIVDENEVVGVNSKSELAQAEGIFQNLKRQEFMALGTTLLDPKSTYFSYDTKVGRDVTIGQNVVIGPNVEIGDFVNIHAFSHLEGCKIKTSANIGPFSRLRPGADIGEGAKVGNFCEIKESKVEGGAKVNHLSYIGDSRVGKGANIGAGTITCNYDGFNKFFTDIGAGAFIGSNTSLVAPVKIGNGAIIGAGSVITNSVDKDALAFVRADFKQVSGGAVKFRKRQKRNKVK